MLKIFAEMYTNIGKKYIPTIKQVLTSYSLHGILSWI